MLFIYGNIYAINVYLTCLII